MAAMPMSRYCAFPVFKHLFLVSLSLSEGDFVFPYFVFIFSCFWYLCTDPSRVL